MRRINILSKYVYNRIAAGEVVDRPYSAVKELVENSIDAKASEIEVYIEVGGKHLIKVVDNGSGILKDDLRTAFLPHATSKISTAADLEKIKTLGFRGEALASISVVSKVKLTSKAKGADAAYSITCDDGEIGEVTPAALDVGTVVEVLDLFYSTPVRQKFLKSDRKEESDITNFISKYILSHPEISFKYYVDGKLALQSFGGGLDEAMVQIYGAKTVSSCFKIDGKVDDIRVYGFIGNQNFFKANKTYQNLFINGRYIVNTTVSAAMTQAYSSYMMKRQYPFYVLFIDMPSELVDVNVHPNKADVRFVDSKQVFSAVYKVVSSVLDGVSYAADFIDESVRIPEIKSTAKGEMLSRSENEAVQQTIDVPFFKLVDEVTKKDEKRELTQEEIKRIKYGEIGADAVDRSEFEKYYQYGTDPMVGPLFPDTEEERKRPKKQIFAVTDDWANPCTYTGELEEMLEAGLDPYQEKVKDESYTYKGNMFNTYLIFEHCDEVILIDQHAAHERIIYDSYVERLKQKGDVPRQRIVPPVNLLGNPIEINFILENMSFFRRVGFSIERYGVQAVTISDIPADLVGVDIEEFFHIIMKDKELLNVKKLTLEDVYKDKLAMSACKAAIKGGTRLTNPEIDKLLKMIDGNFGLKCPHGRPVCIKLTKKQVEKMFKRIV